MPIGIRPTNDFAFKKIFGSPENVEALISLLNAILQLPRAIAKVTILNPFQLQEFQDDKSCILDIKAEDDVGAVYNIEMQVSAVPGLVQRIVFYGCEIYAGQLGAGDNYLELKPAYSICLIRGNLWSDSTKVHHAFRLTDLDSGRTLDETLQIHILELGGYNLKEEDLASASLLDCWLYWLLHADEYDSETLQKLFPQSPIRLATSTIARIAAITEDKQMYDAREKALRDQRWLLNASFEEGKLEGELEGELKGEIKLIRTLSELLGESLDDTLDLQSKSLQELQAITSSLRERLILRRA